ncbi:MAG: AAA family ATPase, partial [Dehalococcoidia bacterium]
GGFSQRTYQEMLRRADSQLAEGKSVVLDASFRTAASRKEVVELGRRRGAEVWVVECVTSEEVLRRRLDRRVAAGTSASDGRWGLLERQREEWEPVAEVSEHRYVRLDTSGRQEETGERLLEEIFARIIGG